MVVAVLCGWEVVALFSPLPTISQMVKRQPLLGVALIALLVDHWWLEGESLSPT
jgi:hypothetical protein